MPKNLATLLASAFTREVSDNAAFWMEARRSSRLLFMDAVLDEIGCALENLDMCPGKT